MGTRALLFVIIAAAVSAAASYFGATYAVAMLERESTSTVQTSLNASGNEWAVVRADGLRVILSGQAPDESARFSALEVTGRVIDTNRIVDELDVASVVVKSVPEFRLAIVRNEGKLSLIGLVPGEDARASTLTQFSALEPGAVTDLMEALDHTPPEGWDDAIAYALAAATRLEQAQISVEPGAVDVTAFLNSADEREALETALAAFQKPELDVSISISAPKPIVSPFVFSAELGEEGLTVAECTINSDAGLAEISASIETATTPNDCTIALGAPSPKWPTAINAGLAALDDLGGGSISITDADVELIGPVGGNVEKFAAVEGSLMAALPDIFSLSATLPPAPENETTSGRAKRIVFTTTVDPDSGITLTGPLRDQRARAAVRNFAAAVFGHDRVTDATTTTINLAEGWTQRVLTSIEALADMHDGQIATYDDEFAINGTVIEETAEDTLVALLQERFEDTPITTDITYKPEIKILIEAPKPEECAARLAALLEGSQIVFAPNSADISGESGLLLDEIAEVILSCPNARFEIGGHTDSQGREAMNLALSQSRAEAVLDSLLARDVLLNFVTAQGYGESTPIASNDDEAGRAINRRIEFNLIQDENAATDDSAETDGTEAEAGDGTAASENDGTEASTQ